MKYTCLQCERTSNNPNLYCQETYCPAEQSPILLDFGEWIGDIEIVKMVTVLHTAVVYEAMHSNEKVYLKVAHPGQEHTERLKREALFLHGQSHEMLPKLRPAYAGTTTKTDPYGKTMLGGHLLYFYLFDFWPGYPLRDILSKNPQLWINHVGWITIGLAEVVNRIHLHKYYHFGLTPEGILIEFDDDEVNTPRILLVDLGIVSTGQELGSNWYPLVAPSAYTAPELLSPDQIEAQPGFGTDVYGVGLILYELLIGEPAFAYAYRSEEDVRRMVAGASQRINIMSRSEDVASIAAIAQQAVNPKFHQRQPDVATLAHQLIGYFGKIPEKKKKRPWPKTSTILVTIAAILVLAFLVTFAISIGNLLVG